MGINTLWTGGVALLMVISLTGCGADANNEALAGAASYTATDSSEMPGKLQEPEEEQAALPLAAIPARSLMPPSGNIVENIARVDSLTRFTAMLKRSDLAKTLNGTGPYTVFAPSNVALEAKYGKPLLKELLKPENKERLQQLVSTHLIAGKLSVADLEDGAVLITAGGQQLKVAKRQGQLRINDALVAIPDAACRNGIVHVVNKVLEPADKQEEQ